MTNHFYRLELVMILMRALAILMGGLLILLVPQFAVEIISELKGESVQATVSVMAAALAGGAALVTGFFFIGILGHRMGRRRWMRVAAGLMLLFPFFGGSMALLFSDLPVVVWIAGPVVCFTCLVFFAFVFPGGKRSTRMRPRDYRDSDVEPAPESSAASTRR
jgi:MFS family permease